MNLSRAELLLERHQSMMKCMVSNPFACPYYLYIIDFLIFFGRVETKDLASKRISA